MHILDLPFKLTRKTPIDRRIYSAACCIAALAVALGCCHAAVKRPAILPEINAQKGPATAVYELERTIPWARFKTHGAPKQPANRPVTLWSVPLPHEWNQPFAVDAGGTIYCGTNAAHGTKPAGELIAIDSKDGRVLWRTKAAYLCQYIQIMGDSLLVLGLRHYGGGLDGVWIYSKRDGKLRSYRAVDPYAFYRIDGISADARVFYRRIQPFDDGLVAAYDVSTLKLLWKKNIGTPPKNGSPTGRRNCRCIAACTRRPAIAKAPGDRNPRMVHDRIDRGVSCDKRADRSTR